MANSSIFAPTICRLLHRGSNTRHKYSHVGATDNKRSSKTKIYSALLETLGWDPAAALKFLGQPRKKNVYQGTTSCYMAFINEGAKQAISKKKMLHGMQWHLPKGKRTCHSAMCAVNHTTKKCAKGAEAGFDVMEGGVKGDAGGLMTSQLSPAGAELLSGTLGLATSKGATSGSTPERERPGGWVGGRLGGGGGGGGGGAGERGMSMVSSNAGSGACP